MATSTDGPLSIRLPSPLRQEVESLRERTGKKSSVVIRELISAGLNSNIQVARLERIDQRLTSIERVLRQLEIAE